ncbi:MAG: helix-turn-helix transcriptional regulator [Phycisphaerales bacterium]|nr:helix-turn-helix transcriptional regulator [Phycisphaerales bacterium]
MSNKRNAHEKAYWDPRFELVPFAFDLSHRHHIVEHEHHRDQLIYASSGVMTVTTAMGAWVVPPTRAVWVPARIKHQLQMYGRVEMRTLYLRAGLVKTLPRSCSVLAVAPLLRELIVHIVGYGPLTRRTPRSRLFLDFLLDQLRELSVVPLHVPWPTDPRLRRSAEALVAHPGESVGLGDFARSAGLSKRTVERLFILQTNLSFRHWRQHVRMLKSLELLAAGKSVTVVGLDVGYAGTSAFIAAFRRAFGTTPRRYYRGDELPH